MLFKTKIKKILCKINPSPHRWRIRLHKKNNMYKVSYIDKHVEEFTCWVQNESDEDLALLYIYTAVELIIAKLIKIQCQLKKKK